MAISNAVWGIDIGQCALKALRCRPHEKDPQRIVAEAFDYVEYPKILSQPEADRDELIRDALETFLSRNDVTGDQLAISVPGQNGLARFIKLPPVESKKIPDIVRYEARQQIPFSLDDVVWDYQRLLGGSEEEGFALETEIGLFAMKRDQVERALKPFTQSGLEVELIQLSPLALYNFACFERLNNLESLSPENLPPSMVVISLGTDTTDLVITNGFRVWQRNIPIGGNHFTKALSKELRLTFAKAEELKRNAASAENPKAVFQAMRPVFSDLVAEIQRSLGFFTSNNRDAKLGDILALGNAFKLPGLQRYLSQNLDQEVILYKDFKHLVGGSATTAPEYKENRLSLAVAYGLCVQGLGLGQLRTSLLPKEIATERLIRSKKPWAVAAASLLMVGMLGNYASHYQSWRSADVTAPAMASAISSSRNLSREVQQLDLQHDQYVSDFDRILQIRDSLQSGADRRLRWLELIKAIDAALPKDERPDEEREQTPEDLMSREELHIEELECEYFEDVQVWFDEFSTRYADAKRGIPPSPAPQATAEGDAAATEGAPDVAAAAANPLPGGSAPDAAPQNETLEPVTGEGWIIQLTGYHFHNLDTNNEQKAFVQNEFLKKLEEGTVELPDGPNGELVEVPIRELGIKYPLIITTELKRDVQYDPEIVDGTSAARRTQSLNFGGPPSSVPPSSAGRSRTGTPVAETEEPEPWNVQRYDFRVQFCWQPVPRSERIAKLREETRQAGEFPETATTDTGGNQG